MGIISAFMRLTRIEHSIMLVIAVAAAELISGVLPGLQILILSFITPIFISMGSFAINDYFDVEADKRNKMMNRPIVSGEITKKSALTISMCCFAIGVIASIFINTDAFLITVIPAAFAILYSYRLKDLALIGNAYIGVSMGIPFLYGNFVVSPVLSNAILAIFFIAFLSGLAREIHGMIRDYKGDSIARSTKNLVHYIGAQASANIAFILYAEAILISIFVFFFIKPFEFSLVYALFIGIADIMLAYTAITCMLHVNSRMIYIRARNISLAAMSLVLFGYLLVPLVHIAL